MFKKLSPLLIVFYLQSCQLSSDANKKLIGSWEVTSYHLEIQAEMDEDLLWEYEKSIERQERKLKEFAEYNFNEDNSYHLIFSPMDEDEGKWSIISDSILIFESSTHHVTDTAYIYFNGNQLATIKMFNDNQTASVGIKKH